MKFCIWIYLLFSCINLHIKLPAVPTLTLAAHNSAIFFFISFDINVSQDFDRSREEKLLEQFETHKKPHKNHFFSFFIGSSFISSLNRESIQFRSCGN